MMTGHQREVAKSKLIAIAFVLLQVSHLPSLFELLTSAFGYFFCGTFIFFSSTASNFISSASKFIANSSL